MQKWIEAEPTQEKANSALGDNLPGVAAEYVVLDAEGVVHVPSHLSDAEAACLPCAGVTAWHATGTSANLKPSGTVLTQGTGGVSLFALQFARTRGTRISEPGARELINYVTSPEWGIATRELTDGVDVDHVPSILAEPARLPSRFAPFAWGGHISMIGVLTGSGQADRDPF
jgi:NADPH:quinone reductase-like Zn-dependent oxidoreductase